VNWSTPAIVSSNWRLYRGFSFKIVEFSLNTWYFFVKGQSNYMRRPISVMADGNSESRIRQVNYQNSRPDSAFSWLAFRDLFDISVAVKCVWFGFVSAGLRALRAWNRQLRHGFPRPKYTELTALRHYKYIAVCLWKTAATKELIWGRVVHISMAIKCSAHL
jgi:hypothetical protein